MVHPIISPYGEDGRRWWFPGFYANPLHHRLPHLLQFYTLTETIGSEKCWAQTPCQRLGEIPNPSRIKAWLLLMKISASLPGSSVSNWPAWRSRPKHFQSAAQLRRCISPFSLSIHSATCPPNYPSIHLLTLPSFTHPSVCLLMHSSFFLFINPNICPFINSHIHPSVIRPSICSFVTICLFIHMSVLPCIDLNKISICQYIYLAIIYVF